ncbi:hypothetical protein YT1_3947 [Rhodococcus ruber]|nr:hypothetical protein YT1_3947 [Rhodococcus ruber]
MFICSGTPWDEALADLRNLTRLSHSRGGRSTAATASATGS